MSGVVKFRAWIERKKELLYLKGFRYSGKEKIKITFADEDCDDCTYTYLKKDVVLEQFTGLHDKNGVEIYEGDIIKNTIGKLEKVAFTNGSFQCASISHPNANLYLLDPYCRFIEVIGNIHESEETSCN